MATKTENESLSNIDYSTEHLHNVSVEMLEVLKKIALTLKSIDHGIGKLLQKP